MDMTLTPIGVVKNSIKDLETEDWKKAVCEIIVNEDQKEALSLIEEFSHVIVLYWMHKVSPSQRLVMRVHPRGRQDLPLVGVLASRSPARPNPIGVSTVTLLERRDNVLKVMGLDAADGTPVLDIKPYIPGYDSPAKAETPDWVTK
ncbi:MAG: tRNA (N6-threonylcarbamoyladenosine(37)-N6)-methyltransferase TrmO [Dehalococcoidia bacterium]|nr:tRNA (N6-threonylcarbamoyladenosine(37)-N6)-methyltransferase TrmO [Dehalococcoidia bacterium]